MRIAFIGRIGAGKDFLASELVRIGFVRLSFSDPIHQFVRDHVTRRAYEKGEPGIRRLLQTAGASGRGDVPTPGWLDRIVRALNISDWGDQDFWVARLAQKLDSVKEATDIVISDCRHENELTFARRHGFELFGVVCSELTRHKRLADRGEQYSQETEGHVSEKLSLSLDSIVDAEHMIWNDEVPPPDDRYTPYCKFLQVIAERDQCPQKQIRSPKSAAGDAP